MSRTAVRSPVTCTRTDDEIATAVHAEGGVGEQAESAKTRVVAPITADVARNHIPPVSDRSVAESWLPDDD
jgi:hypothetical protein